MILPKFFLSYWDQNHSMTPDILTESCTPCQSMSLGKSIFLMCVIWSLKSCCLSSVPSELEGCHSSKPLTVDSSPLACITMGAALVLFRQVCSKLCRWSVITGMSPIFQSVASLILWKLWPMLPRFSHMSVCTWSCFCCFRQFLSILFFPPQSKGC